MLRARAAMYRPLVQPMYLDPQPAEWFRRLRDSYFIPVIGDLMRDRKGRFKPSEYMSWLTGKPIPQPRLRDDPVWVGADEQSVAIFRRQMNDWAAQ